MEIVQSALARLTLYACLLGAALGAVYDLLRLSRVFLGVHYSQRAAKRLQAIRLPLIGPRTKKKKSPALGIVVFLEDFLFCIFAGITLILLFYEYNNGKIRYVAFLGAALGFLGYRGTLGRVVMLFSEAITFLVETGLRYIFFFGAYPFRILGRLVGRLSLGALRGVQNAVGKRRRRRYTARERARGIQTAWGLIPNESFAVAKKIKRGKKLETVQSNASDPRAPGYADSRIRGRFSQQRDEI